MPSSRIIQPDRLLAPYVRHYWILQDEACEAVSERTLPTGCIQWVFHRGKRLLSLKEDALQPDSFVCGQSREFTDVLSTGAIDMIAVVFQPHAARAVLKTPLHLFHGQNISTDDLEDDELRVLSQRIADAPDSLASIQWIEKFLISRLARFEGYNLPRVHAVIRQINGLPDVPLSRLADTACVSLKLLSRIFMEYVGSSPKEFMRIVRLQRALFLMQQNPGMPFARLAYACGFSDQSHMIREFRQFSGYTPGEYLQVCAPYSDYFSFL